MLTFNQTAAMLITIKGIYNNGQVILDEMPETAGPVDVLVTFTQDITTDQSKNMKKRVFGIGRGEGYYMSPDFNDPLEEMKGYM